MATFQTIITDLKRAEQRLEKQLESVQAAIAAIAGRTSRRQGLTRRRRRMSPAQRKAVSKRMKKYWAARRKVKT